MGETINLEEWYNAAEAVKRLSQNSGRTIDASYTRSLARDGKVRTWHLDGRTVLYWKADIDAYVVEERGKNLRGAKRPRAR